MHIYLQTNKIIPNDTKDRMVFFSTKKPSGVSPSVRTCCHRNSAVDVIQLSIDNNVRIYILLATRHIALLQPFLFFFCEKGEHHINMIYKIKYSATPFAEGSLRNSANTKKTPFFFLSSSRLCLCSIRFAALQIASPPSSPRIQTKKAPPQGKPQEILGKRTSAVELPCLTT
jgi:hypothetical protein